MIESKEERKARKLKVRGVQYVTNGTLVNVPKRPTKAQRRAGASLAQWKATKTQKLVNQSRGGVRRMNEQADRQ